MTRFFRLFAVLAVIFSTSANADLYDDYINSTSKQYYAEFLARKGVPGHAFVALRVNLDSNLSIRLRVFGLFPENGVKSSIKAVFSKTSGKIGMKFEDLQWDTNYSVPVSAEKFEATMKAFERWSSNAPDYSLLANDGKNCNSFAGEVASAIGLIVPAGAGTTLPPNYIEALRKANQ